VWGGVKTQALLLPRSETSIIEFSGLKGGFMGGWPGQLVLDNSNRNLWRACHLKYKIKTLDGIQTKKGSTALRYGAAWHGFKEGFYREILASGWGASRIAMIGGISLAKDVWEIESKDREFYDDYRTFDNLTTAAMKWVDYYPEDPDSLELIATEKVFELEMFPLSPDELLRWPGPKPESLLFTGKIDLQYKLYGIPWITDTKTTGNPLATESGRLHRSAQLMGYSYASNKVLDFKPNGCMVDYLHTSGRRNKDGDYGTIKYDFARVPHIFTDKDLLSWRRSYLAVAKEIYEAMCTGDFDQCQDSCFNYNRNCGLLGICEQNKEVVDVSLDENYIYRPWDVRDSMRVE
jgi:hypothetical protein